MEELNSPSTLPGKHFCDNKEAISLAHYLVHHDRTKDFGGQYSIDTSSKREFIQEYVNGLYPYHSTNYIHFDQMVAETHLKYLCGQDENDEYLFHHDEEC